MIEFYQKGGEKMKKKILIIAMIVVIILNISSVFAITFYSDVPNEHWAKNYIYIMQHKNVINGYEDGTFKPENALKTGELIKMLTMLIYPDYEYKTPGSGEHWSQPYVNIADNIILHRRDYDYERLDRVITRAEATELLCRIVQFANLDNREYISLRKDGEYIKQFKDEATITDEKSRVFIDNCVRFGLINGFEDGTFRANEGLTRAQAAKLLCSIRKVEKEK